MPKPFLIIGHRGASGHEPENTLCSFQRALDLGADAIELDVQQCASGELVVIHDETVDRTTNGRGRVMDLSFDELRLLDAGHGERIPTLIEVFDLVDRRVSIHVELKSPGAADPVNQLITGHATSRGWSPEYFVVSSFDHPELARFRALRPDIRIGPLISGALTNSVRLAIDLGAWSINASLEFVDRAFVEEAHSQGLKVLVYTVNEEDNIRRMIELGADGIFTNFPDRARAVLGR